MRKWFAIGIVWAVTLLGTGLWVHAQSKPRILPLPGQFPNTDSDIPQIISGADIGFRVDGWSKDGTPIGRIVVHQEGKWLDVTLSGRVRPLATN